jgi:hypothetical protein
MQKMYPRTNSAPFEVPEKSNAKPVPQIEEALREIASQNAAHLRHEPEISDLQLHDFLHSESERIQQEIADYLQLSQTAMGSTKIIANNIVLCHRRPRLPPKTSLSRRNDLAPVVVWPFECDRSV